MAIEDFTTYTEVDANGKLTVTSSKAEGVDVDRDEDVYLYKDKGADHFNALDEEFELYIASTSVPACTAGMAIANTVGTIMQFATTDVSVFGTEVAGPAARIYLRRGAGVADDYYDCSLDTLYYCTLERVAGNDAISLKIYSDAARTNLLDTLSLAGFGTVKWRYVYGFVNFNDGEVNKDFDGYIQNLDLKEDVVVTPSTLALILTSYIPILELKVTPSTLALSLTFYNAIFGFGVVPSALALALTLNNAVFGFGVVPSTLALTLSTYAPWLKLPIRRDLSTFVGRDLSTITTRDLQDFTGRNLE